MKPFFLFIFFYFFQLNLQGQITFQKTIGGTQNDLAWSIDLTFDGGYALTGRSGSNSDIYIIKTDINGDTIWTRTYGGAGFDFGYSIKQTLDSGFIVTGYTTSFGAGGYDLILLKTDINGDLIWCKTYGGTLADEGTAVQQTPDGGYIIIGDTRSFSSGIGDIWLIKTDANGDSLWTKTYGGTNDEIGRWVEQTTDGGFILAGYTKSFGAGTGGTGDYYLIKTDANGETLWSKSYGGTQDDWPWQVHQTSDGGYIIVGEATSFGVGNGDVNLIKTDVGGNISWTKTYGSITIDVGQSVQQMPDNGFIIGGYTSNNGYDAYLIRTDDLGDTLWTRTYGGTNQDAVFCVQRTSDGGFLFGGETQSYGAGSLDVYLIKTDSNGLGVCNQTSFTTTVNSTSTVVTMPVSLISFGGVIGNPTLVKSNLGISNTLCTTIGIDYFNNQSTIPKIYPNPTSDHFFIDANTTDKLTIDLYDVNGIHAFSESVMDKSNINVTTLDNGIYTMTIKSGDRVTNTKLVIVR